MYFIVERAPRNVARAPYFLFYDQKIFLGSSLDAMYWMTVFFWQINEMKLKLKLQYLITFHDVCSTHLSSVLQNVAVIIWVSCNGIKALCENVTQHIRDVMSSLRNSPVLLYARGRLQRKEEKKSQRLTQKPDQPFTIIFFLHFSWKFL